MQMNVEIRSALKDNSVTIKELAASLQIPYSTFLRQLGRAEFPRNEVNAMLKQIERIGEYKAQRKAETAYITKEKRVMKG